MKFKTFSVTLSSRTTADQNHYTKAVKKCGKVKKSLEGIVANKNCIHKEKETKITTI
jgi:hypothetical protein